MQLKRHQQIGAFLRASARLLSLLLLGFAFAGCKGTPSTTITTDDGRIFSPSFRLAVDLDDSKQPPSEQHTGHAMEIEAGKAKGGGNQVLAAGQPPVIINNTTFYGPQQLRNSFEFDYASISYRARRFFGERQLIGLEGSLGMGYASMGLTVASPTQHDSGRYANIGGIASFGLVVRMGPSTSMHILWTGFRFPNAFGPQGIFSTDRSEIFLEQAVGNNVTLRAGYGYWVIDGSTGMGSDIRTTFSGPRFDLGLNF